MFPCLGASGKLDIFLQHYFDAHCFLYLFFIINITVWLTLLCVLFDFYWIYIKICGESVPLRPDKTEIIYKELGGPYQIGKALRALFSLPESVFKRVTQGNRKNKKGCEYMTNAKQTNCAKYARGPPKWIRTDSLSWIKTEKVNQFWFTSSNRPNLPRVGRMLLTAQRMRWTPQNRRLARLWGCGAAWAVQLNTRE